MEELKLKLLDVQHILKNNLTKKVILDNLKDYINYSKCIESIDVHLNSLDNYNDNLDDEDRRIFLDALDKHLTHFIRNTKDANKINLYHMELLNDMNFFIDGIDIEESINNEMENEVSYKIDKSKSIWIISPGKNAVIWEECRDNNYIAIGWDKVNVNDYNTKTELKKVLTSEYNLDKNHRVANFLWYFAKELKVGDIVIARKGRSKIIGIGEVMSDYMPPNDFNNPRKKKDFKQVREVNWFDVSEYSIDKPFGINTVSKVHSNPQIKKILEESWSKYDRSIELDNTIDLGKLTKPRKNTELKEMKKNFSDKKIEYDFKYKNILLKGVPGTGKSLTLDNIINNHLDLRNYPNNILRINIHSASSNSDLMQGIGISSKEDGGIEYKEKQGLILRLIEKAIFNPNQPFVLVLEEIQENSLNELIGDLIYLIEDDKRAKKVEPDNEEYTYADLVNKIINETDSNVVKLPSLISHDSKSKKMILPNNLFIFCTSNYRDDRKVIEDNLLRRFEVIEIYPKYKEDIGDDFKTSEVSRFLKDLNQKIVKVCKSNGEIHPDRFMIGHSIWLKVNNEESFSRAFLKVLIEFKDVKEMHYDDFEKIIKGLKFPMKIKSDYNGYEEWIKALQSKCYNFLG